MIKALSKMGYLDRELYFLEVALYSVEKEVLLAGYTVPTSLRFIKDGIDAGRIIKALLLLYGKDIFLDYNRITLTQKYIANRCNLNVEVYVKHYIESKGRLPLNDYRY
jgi:hypothetical protein